MIKEVKLTNDVKLVSFDVTSLFTNVSVDHRVDDIVNKLLSSDVAPGLHFLHFKKTITQIIFKKF